MCTQEEAYEWCKSYADFRHLVVPHLTPASSILILGCGNSALPLELHRDGFKRLSCLDISPNVIRQMRGRAATQVAVSMLPGSGCAGLHECRHMSGAQGCASPDVRGHAVCCRRAWQT